MKIMYQEESAASFMAFITINIKKLALLEFAMT